MAYADRYTGKDAVVEWLKTGEVTPITVSADYTEYSLDISTDTVDVTAGNELNRSFIPTQTGAEFTLMLYLGNETDFSKITAGSTGKLTIYPKGKVAGRPVREFNAIITGFNQTSPFDGAVEVEISGIRNGAFIKGVGDTYSTGSAPVAAFSVNDVTATVGQVLTFTDASTNTPTGWLWDFGNGQTSNVQNPVYAYPATGTYTVTLTATNAAGSDQEIKTGYITVS